MHNHVRVMLALINPYQNEYVELAHLSGHMQHYNLMGTNSMDKWIALEVLTTAQSMLNIITFPF